MLLTTTPVITKLGKKLGLRQRVIATATVFFRRFYLKNSYCETDPFLVIAACCYVAAKAEESPVHIKTVISEARTLFSRTFLCIAFFFSPSSFFRGHVQHQTFPYRQLQTGGNGILPRR